MTVDVEMTGDVEMREECEKSWCDEILLRAHGDLHTFCLLPWHALMRGFWIIVL
jgi:hypothetical protein